MVMPCSRSAERPSTRSAKSIASPCVPWRLLSASSAASWSSKICFVSYSSRPIRVDLPSSTLPQVMKRRSSLPSCSASHARTSAGALTSTTRSSRACRGTALLLQTECRTGLRQAQAERLWACWSLEVALLLLLLHARGARVAVDDPAFALRGARGEHLGDDLLDRLRVAFDRARQGIAAERPEPHLARDHRLARLEPHALIVDHQDHAVANHRRALRGEVERDDLDLLPEDILPDVELGPVGQREHADALALVLPDVVQRP